MEFSQKKDKKWNCHSKVFSLYCRSIVADGGLRKDFQSSRIWKLVLLIQFNCVCHICIIINGHSVGI